MMRKKSTYTERLSSQQSSNSIFLKIGTVLSSVALLLVLLLLDCCLNEFRCNKLWLVYGLLMGSILVFIFILGKVRKKKVYYISIAITLALIGFSFLLRRLSLEYDSFMLGVMIIYFVSLLSVSVYRKRPISWNDLIKS